MKKRLSILVTAGSGLLLLALTAYGQEFSVSDLNENGAGGFPQSQAEVLFDTEDLKVSILNDASYLAIQAIVWKDDSPEQLPDSAGRLLTDHSSLIAFWGDRSSLQPRAGRTFSINPWPNKLGLHHQIYLGKRARSAVMPDGTKRTVEVDAYSGLQRNWRGLGKIEYLYVGGGRRVRVDTMLVSLSEINKAPDGILQVCYRVNSPSPQLRLRSCEGHFHTVVLEKTKANTLRKLIPSEPR
jgi:hypothetical protein